MNDFNGAAAQKVVDEITTGSMAVVPTAMTHSHAHSSQLAERQSLTLRRWRMGQLSSKQRRMLLEEFQSSSTMLVF